MINMCKALDEIYEKGQATGEVRGEARGIEMEKQSIIRRLLRENIALEQIMRFCDCSAEYVERIKNRGLGEAML